MSLALHVGNWWECSGDELCTMNLRRSNFIAHVITSVGTNLKLRYDNLMSTSSGTYVLAKNLIKVFYISIFICVDTMALNFRHLVLFVLFKIEKAFAF